MSSSKLIHIASIAALAFGVSQVALAASELSRGDRKFVEEAAQGGMAEVELGKLAEQHAMSDQVKQFGRKMATDHQKANEQLKKIAAAKGINRPADMSSGDRREFDKLSQKTGADFDREYMKE